ncbi:ATP-binding protein [Streptomyces sp. NPDC052077]|uniref:ATP-binding protein n=1 Tax=Streptomyces sp. NPDC052077 TaxID=3154757 RepID=UPI00343DDBFF
MGSGNHDERAQHHLPGGALASRAGRRCRRGTRGTGGGRHRPSVLRRLARRPRRGPLRGTGVLRERGTGPGAGSAVRTFSRDAASVPVARHFVVATLAEWRLHALVDEAELIVSELASNAVLHACGDSFRVALRRFDAHRLGIAVADRSRTLPASRAPDAADGHGRGLAIVGGVSLRWGTDVHSWGKSVWAELAVPVTVHRDSARLASPGAERAAVRP